MQTFLPYKNFKKSAQALDSKRLNKQVLECYQILKVLSNKDPFAGWRNHPAVKMWRGHEQSLWDYTFAMVAEASSRGIKVDKNVANLTALRKQLGHEWGVGLPSWYSDNEAMVRVTTTHRANLYNKDSIYYFNFASDITSANNKPCCPNRKEPCKYYWVAHEEKFVNANN